MQDLKNIACAQGNMWLINILCVTFSNEILVYSVLPHAFFFINSTVLWENEYFIIYNLTRSFACQVICCGSSNNDNNSKNFFILICLGP